jgi:hypothetical protein
MGTTRGWQRWRENWRGCAPFCSNRSDTKQALRERAVPRRVRHLSMERRQQLYR